MPPLRLLLAVLAISLILHAEQWERDEDDDPAARHAWFYSQRAFPAASIPPGARRNAMLQIARTDALARLQRQGFLPAAVGQNSRTVAAIDAADWTLIGPRPTDGGAPWVNILGPFLRDKIGALVVHPTNSQILLCTSTTGVWRSADAGATWTSVLAGANGISLAVDPTNGDSIYVSLGAALGNAKNGVYHSTDAGLTWEHVIGTGSASLPTANLGRIAIALAASDPATLYVQIQNSLTASFGTLLGIYKTTDGGTTWTRLPVPASIPAFWGTQLSYDNSISIHPTAPHAL